MDILNNLDLQPFNTLSVPSTAQNFCVVESTAELLEAITWAKERELRLQLLGGGSNVILAESINGLIVKPDIRGRDVESQSDDDVFVRFGAGENWHEVVIWTLQQGYYGLEALALIPGTVGAAPVQNIGAYGVELSHFVVKLECINLKTGEAFELSGEQCEFAYRESVFKGRLQNSAAITYVTLRLSTHYSPITSLYPALEQRLKAVQGISPQMIFDEVCSIRREKLPDPEDIPNCGSFFKNPVVTWQKYKQLEALYPQMPSYSATLALNESESDESRKLAAAWLIDQAGWKGREMAGIKVHDKQALVLTNPNGLSSLRVLELADKIKQSVQKEFGVLLETEPQEMC